MATHATAFKPVSNAIVWRRWFSSFTIIIAVVVFVSMLICLEIGRQFGIQEAAKYGATAQEGVAVVDGVAAALLALLIGFFFSGASARYDQRRKLVATEVNTIGTAWQRVEALPEHARPRVHEGFRRYLDEMIESYGGGSNVIDPLREPPSMTAAQNELWSQSVKACLSEGGEPARMLLLPGLNDMFGAVESERLARRIHPPLFIYAMLAFSIIATGLFSGYGTAQGPRNWLFLVGASATIAVAIFVIIELEYPRLGRFRMDAMDQALIDLRKTMG